LPTGISVLEAGHEGIRISMDDAGSNKGKDYVSHGYQLVWKHYREF
jgi:hypothetical protein